jgi:hypothetical protein
MIMAMMSCSLKKAFTSRNKKLAVSREAFIILFVVRDMNHKVKVAKGIFGFVFENRDKFDTNVYRTLTHDLGIIIRGDKLAMPYTAGKETVMEEFLATS